MFKKTVAFILVSVLAACLVFSADNSAKPEVPQTLKDKFSYAYGIYMLQVAGENAGYYFTMSQRTTYPELDPYYGYMGMNDFVQGKSKFTVNELNSILQEYFKDYEARMTVLAEANLKAAEEFLAENKTKEGIHVTESGLQYKILKQGTGEKATATDTVELDYELRLLDGTVLDSSYKRGTHHKLSMTQVIAGFKEGVLLMPMGSHYILYVHPDIGYGSGPSGNIEPNSLLVFEIETYSIVK